MQPQKLLMAHDFYRLSGGEEQSFFAEVEMLRARGHEVVTYVRSNAEIDERRLNAKLRLAVDTIWSKESYSALVELIRKHKPQIAHFQNTFPLISPSAYYACKEEGVPVVQTLRNYRLICPNAILLREGRICHDCVGKAVAWPGVVHACYRHSRSASATVAAMVAYHRVRGTWARKVDAYIALTETARRKLVEGGLPPERTHIKPNFVSDPGATPSGNTYVIFVGRLSQEKGIQVLLEAWRELPNIPLQIAGDGPMADFARIQIERHQINANLLGQLSHAEAVSAIRGSAFVLFPSIWHETFGRTIIEAYACGKPVVGSKSGTALELILDGRTGLHFNWNDAADLARQVRRLWGDPAAIEKMSRHARQEYLSSYTPQRNYEQLMSIYENARNTAQ
jgi:glycosyltransferase involved in cell wall biosynthesis